MTVRAIEGDAPRLPRISPASNGYAGEVPAYSLVKPTARPDGVWAITRPDADSMANVFATGPAKIAEDANGLVSANWPLPVKYAGADPSVGDERGTAADSFELTAGKTGFNIVAVDTTNKLAWVVPVGGSGLPEPGDDYQVLMSYDGEWIVDYPRGHA